MATSKLKVNIKMRKWIVRLMFPLWFVQVYFGFKPWIPDCMFKSEVVKG